MPKGVPFSNKQKKKQLQEKRQRKQARPGHYGNDDEDDDSETPGSSRPGRGSDRQYVKKINLQSKNKDDKRYNPNRYRLQFTQESRAEIERRKKLSYLPVLQLSEEGLEQGTDLKYDSEAGFDIPKRPAWDYSLSKQRLENNEDKYFQEYVSCLCERYSQEELGYFELNLETWRQLWRVLEMSDILLMITDIRHPSVNFSPALYHYVTVELKKSMILVLNKADLAPPQLVVAWQHFFEQKFPLVNVIVFTSFPKDEQELIALGEESHTAVQKKRKRGTYTAIGPQELLHVCEKLVDTRVDLNSWAAKIEEDQRDFSVGENVTEADHTIVTAGVDLSFHQHEQFKGGVLTIGCLGFPNVGKSSIINGLMGKKVVSVSRTPGHTKHFQTIHLTRTVRLCDCPGLVFPALVDKTLQVLTGSYPIAQVREPFTPVGYLAQRLDMPRLLHLKHPYRNERQGSPSWSAMDICEAFAELRGFITAKAGRKDAYRAANYLLRMAVGGRLSLCLTPPGYTKSKEFWSTHPDTQKLRDLQIKYRLKPSQSKDSDTYASSSDEESGQGEELSNDDEADNEDEEEEPVSFTSTNPYALLMDD